MLANYIDEDSIGEIAIETDLSGKILRWNKAGEDITYYSDAEVKGKSIRKLFTPESTKRLQRIMEFVKMGSTFPALQFEMKIKNGQIMPVDVSVSPLKKEETITGFTFIVRDVTLRELLQKKLDEMNALYKGLVEQSPSMIYLLDTDGKIIFINETGEKMLGYSRDEMIGKELVDFVYPEDRERNYWNVRERRRPSRATRSLELRLLPRERKERRFELDFIYVSLNSFGVYVKGKKKSDGEFIGTQGIARDITELKVLKNFIRNVQGIIPICSVCYKVRVEEEGKEKWLPIERYITIKGGAKFSHTICPECARHIKEDGS